MRALLLTPVLFACALGGCSLARAGLLDAPAPPAASAPARAYHDTSKGRFAWHDLAPLLTEERGRAGIATSDRGMPALAVRLPLPARPIGDADPIRGAFDALPEGHRWVPEAFLPSGGTLDLTRVGRGRLHVRAWNQDESFRGGGLGVTVPLRSGWHASAEVGVDPHRRPEGGGLAVLAGFGLCL